MGWKEIRDDLVDTLETVAITTPSAMTIKRVYPTPPGTVQDLPAIIVFSPSRHIERSFGGTQRMYAVRCRLLLTDSDKDVGADIVDAFSEALITAFNTNNKIGATPPYGVIVQQDIAEPGTLTAGGKTYSGFDCTFTLNIRGPETLSA